GQIEQELQWGGGAVRLLGVAREHRGSAVLVGCVSLAHGRNPDIPRAHDASAEGSWDRGGRFRGSGKWATAGAGRRTISHVADGVSFTYRQSCVNRALALIFGEANLSSAAVLTVRPVPEGPHVPSDPSCRARHRRAGGHRPCRLLQLGAIRRTGRHLRFK